MRIPASFCTICTGQLKHELFGFLLSLSLHHRNAHVVVYCDSETREYIKMSTPVIQLSIDWTVNLDYWTNMNRTQMEKEGIFDKFLKSKTYVLEEAINRYGDSMFIDSDTIILDTLFVEEPDKVLGVSPQYITQQHVDRTGYYNAGLLWTSAPDLPARWRELFAESRYFEQAVIENLAKEFPSFDYDDNYNLQTWRFLYGIDSEKVIVSKIIPKNKQLMYGDKPLKFIHTHLRSQQFNNLNKFFMQQMIRASLYKELAIVARVINDKWVIKIPKQPLYPPYDHTDDSFRELAPLWMQHHNDVVVIKGQERHCWLCGSIMLYDRDTTKWIDKEVASALHALVGNCDLSVDEIAFQKIGISVQPWIYWPRHPIIIENKMHTIPDYNERKHFTMFLGNIENAVQGAYRENLGWDKVVDDYICTKGIHHKYTQEEYLDHIRNAKFGLCLRGFGSKCHREVELMAMGTVPIITPNVCIDSYANPPIEGIHFIRVNQPSELNKVINAVNEEKWREMSDACIKWYMQNVHSNNSWKTTINAILYNN